MINISEKSPEYMNRLAVNNKAGMRREKEIIFYG